MMYSAIVICSVLLVGMSHGHEWGMGSCASVPPINNFDIDEFLGLWYVIEQFDTSSTCLTFNFTRVSETQLKVTKHRQFYLLDRMGMDHTNSYTGSLDIPYSSNPAMLRVKWPLNAAGKGDYIVFATDYENYAGVYDCQQITFFAFRESAAILSRTPTLNRTIINQLRQQLSSYKVDLSDLNKIDHSSCRAEGNAKVQLNVDQNTFKNFFYRSVDSIKNAANTVSDGVTTGYKYIASKFQKQPKIDLKDLSHLVEFRLKEYAEQEDQQLLD